MKPVLGYGMQGLFGAHDVESRCRGFRVYVGERSRYKVGLEDYALQPETL